MHQKRYLPYINSFRGFAMLLIVAMHCIYLIRDAAPRQYRFLDVVFSNSSVSFLFISGFLFQYLLKDYKYTVYLGKKFRFVILPYLITSMPAIYLALTKSPYLQPSWIADADFLSKPVFLQVILYYLYGAHMPHLWFIPVITVFYLVTPLLRYLDNHPRWYIMIPFLLILSYVIGRPPLNNKILHSFVFFLPSYLMGMCASHYLDATIRFLSKYWVPVLLVTIGLTAYAYINPHVNFLLNLGMTYLVLLLFYRFPSRVSDGIFGLVATYSFGIYFIHKYVLILMISLMYKLSLESFFTSGSFGLFWFFLLNVAVCILFLVPVKLLFKKHSRLIIGS